MSDNTRHTPGPWFVFPRGERGMLHVGPAGHSVAFIIEVDDAEANARLIASCPDMLAEIERLRATLPRWIPVTERLPEWGVPVIGWFPGATQSFECALNEHDGVWCDYGTGIYLYENERPSHWMPLPAPPEALAD